MSSIAPSFAVFNGIDLDIYDFAAEVANDAPLVFLGRIEPVKGTHNAITIALKTGRKLVIAGNIPDEHQGYFEQKVKPFLGEQVSYIGPVNDQQKNRLLGTAAAFLMPIEWNEPFGIVMAEALACGTPVLGLSRGAVPEVVKNGLNGYSCETTDQLIEKVHKIPEINRLDVRQDAERRFSSNVIIDEYISIYNKLIKRSK